MCLLLSAFLPVGCGRPYSNAASQVTNVNRDALAADEIAVVTFNMLHGYRNRTNDRSLEQRLQLLVREIAEKRPDVVILQEASVTPANHGNVVHKIRASLNERLVGTGISYNSVFAMANGSRLIGFFEGSAILSRSEILSAESLAYAAQTVIPPERRIALRARVRTTAGTIEIVGTHLTNTEARSGGRLKRTLQAEELASWLKRDAGPGRLFIIGGDFNDVPDSGTIRALIAAGARDAWTAAVSGAGDVGRSGSTSLTGDVTDASAMADSRIDYIFILPDGANVMAAEPFLDHPFPTVGSGVLWASDHVGVMVHLRLR